MQKFDYQSWLGKVYISAALYFIQKAAKFYRPFKINDCFDRQYIADYVSSQKHYFRGDILEFAGNVSYARLLGGGEKVHIMAYDKQKKEYPDADFYGDIENGIALPRQKFDCIIATQVLMYMTKLDQTLQNLKRMLKPRGKLLLTVPGTISGHFIGSRGKLGFTQEGLAEIIERNFGDKSLLDIHTFGSKSGALAALFWMSKDAVHVTKEDSQYAVIIGALCENKENAPKDSPQKVIIREVKENKDKILQKEVAPNVIHNRYDILYGGQNAENSRGGVSSDYTMYCLVYDHHQFYVPVHFEAQEARVGMYLRKLPQEIWQAFEAFLFATHQKLERIRLLHTYTPIEGINPQPHWHVDLPDTVEEFDACLHAQTRYNTKRHSKKIKKTLGDYEIFCISPKDAQKYTELYLEWKKQIYGYIFGGTAQAYLSQAGVTSVYVMISKQDVLAVGFLAETRDNAFLENFSYNPSYHKLSLGSVLYYHMIKDLIAKHKKKFYLLGGTSEYKQHFNGICTMTYTGSVFRHKIMARIVETLAHKINLLPFSYRIRKRMAKFLGIFIPLRFYVQYLKERILK